MNLDFDPTNVLEPLGDEAARDLWKRGSLAEAEELYASMLLRRPRDPRLLLDAGRLSDELGRTDEAIERLRRAIASSESHPSIGEEARATLAKVLMHRGAFAEAAGVWWRLARQGADRARGWAGLATCAHFAGQSRLVRRCENKLAGKVSRQERRRLLAEMWVHGAGGDLDLAPARPAPAPVGQSPLIRLLRASSRTLRHHATLHRGRADTHFHVAVCAEALGEIHVAETAIRHALEINPRYAAARAFGARLAA